jgi:hypothetical protein
MQIGHQLLLILLDVGEDVEEAVQIVLVTDVECQRNAVDANLLEDVLSAKYFPKKCLKIIATLSFY